MLSSEARKPGRDEEEATLERKARDSRSVRKELVVVDPDIGGELRRAMTVVSKTLSDLSSA